MGTTPSVTDVRRNTRRAHELVLAAGLGAPSQARHWAGWVSDYLPKRRADDALLMLTELVTNSVLHAGLSPGDPIHVTGRVAEDAVRITVCDCGTGFEMEGAPSLPDDDTPGGRGLWIVNRLADRLLVDGAGGKVVFELARAARREPAIH